VYCTADYDAAQDPETLFNAAFEEGRDDAASEERGGPLHTTVRDPKTPVCSKRDRETGGQGDRAGETKRERERKKDIEIHNERNRMT
jgi:hypothetical protein